MNKIIITGPMGQDGKILTNLLRDNNKLLGICRIDSDENRIEEHSKKYEIELLKCDLTDCTSTSKIISEFKPDTIINFAGESDVMSPWENPEQTFRQNYLIPQNILTSITKNNLDTFFFQSSSSLMYAKSEDKIINEKSNFAPMYPYGISKISTQLLMDEYRKNFGLKCSSGIFFNHESSYRNDKFLTKKVSKFISEILKGKSEKIKLYNLNTFRDISHANDFMLGVKLIVEKQISDNFVFSSNKLTNIYDFIKLFFDYNNLDINEHIELYNSNEYSYDYKIMGDSTKLKSIGWSPKLDINDIVKDILIN